jgi:beta-lactamase regulating signal transducer with metallopeptidase domain
MLDRIVFDWNQVAGLVMAAFVNAFPASVFLLAVAWVLLLVQKRCTAASRYWVWWIVLASLALLPLAYAFLPEHPKRLQTEVRDRDARSKHVLALDASSLAAPLPHSAPRVRNVRPLSGLTISGLFLLLWVAAIVFQLARVAFAFRNTIRLKRSAILPSAELEKTWQECLHVCRIRRPVALGVSSDITTPAASGYFRAVILLPASVSNTLTSNELHQIILHELAHVRRCDDWAVTVQRFIEAVLVLHPLARLITRKMELEREIACDDWVLATQEPQAYASCLAKLAEFCSLGRPPRLTTAAVEHKSELSQRIEMLLDRTRSIATRPSLRSLGSLAIIMLVLAFASMRLPLLMAYPTSQSPAPPQAPAAPKAPELPQPASQPLPPNPPPLPESRLTAQRPPSPPPPAAPSDLLRSVQQALQDLESTGAYQNLLKESVRRALEQAKVADPELNRDAINKLMAEIQRDFKARENAVDYDELKREIADAQNQVGKLDSEKLIREMERSQKEMSQIDMAELKREIERCKQELSHINVEELQREIKRLQDEVRALSRGSGRRVP